MELLSPAGNYQKLRYAVAYGADAVYAAGQEYGLRARSGNLSREELRSAVNFVRKHNRRLYIAVNIFAHNRDLKSLPEYLEFLNDLQVDGLIISDPGIFRFAVKYASGIPIHISTQANITSWSAASFWRDLGVRRVILARELSLDEIYEFKKHLPGLELEMFVYGAMCMSYSGRCLLSAYLNGRSANQGDCSQPCRWEYVFQERSRPGENFTITEDSRGSYIFNSRDLNLIDRLLEIRDSGIDSVKIEGRMKSLYYVSNVTRVWREAVDLATEGDKASKELREELEKVSHRVYCEGFADGLNNLQNQYYESSAYIRNYQYLGEIISDETDMIRVNVKAKFGKDEEIELIFPDRRFDRKIVPHSIFDEEGKQISFTKPNTVITIANTGEYPGFGILRKKIR